MVLSNLRNLYIKTYYQQTELPYCNFIFMEITTIANRLTELCTAGNFPQAQKELYNEDIVSIEVDGSRLEGLPTLLAKEQSFLDSLEKINLVEFSQPLIAGNYFTVKLTMDINIRNIGQRRVEELCVYQVAEGKIVFEQFFRNR